MNTGWRLIKENPFTVEDLQGNNIPVYKYETPDGIAHFIIFEEKAVFIQVPPKLIDGIRLSNYVEQAIRFPTFQTKALTSTKIQSIINQASVVSIGSP